MFFNVIGKQASSLQIRRKSEAIVTHRQLQLQMRYLPFDRGRAKPLLILRHQIHFPFQSLPYKKRVGRNNV